ncbi:hypothetical protein [Vibrio diabolicus]|nr:hypothetical protein [Vibrio diabolicus]MCS0342923.1 hypothetical protein [Vibrio diabolicus]
MDTVHLMDSVVPSDSRFTDINAIHILNMATNVTVAHSELEHGLLSVGS